MTNKSLFSMLPFHYGWVVVFSGTLGVLACLGFGRFTIGMLLPSIGESLNLTYSQMGFISTGNFLGYLAAVLISGLWAIRIGARRLIFIALILVGATMILSSMADGFLYLLITFTLTGIGSGASNVPIMALVTSWFGKRLRGRAAGFVVAGSGFAIIFSGRFIPFVNDASITGEGWRTAWLILGVIVLLIAFICLLLLRDRPADLGLKQAGYDENIDSPPSEINRGGQQSLYKRGIIYYLGIIYFFFGFTYVIYITFIVTTLIKERGITEIMAGNLWSTIGFLSLFSGPVFGLLSDKYGRKAGLITVFSFQMFAYLFIASELPDIFLYLSIGLFGVVAWSIPSIMAATVYDYVKSEKAAAAFGIVTFIFGIGQIVGPAVAGTLAEASGSFSSSFYMAAAFAGFAIILTTFLKKT
ncbi:MAG: MFS transporter [Bacteroidetes bacterium]|nr:MFS transporter [Bacteroidota bacterium]